MGTIVARDSFRISTGSSRNRAETATNRRESANFWH
jgi:hypothetical protein